MITCYGIDSSQIEWIQERPVRCWRIGRREGIPFLRKAIPATVQQAARQSIIGHLVLNARQNGYLISHQEGDGYSDQHSSYQNQRQQLPVIDSISVEHDVPQGRPHRRVRPAYASYDSLRNAAWLPCPSL